MEIFPETALISNPLSIGEVWKTRISDFESGKERREKCWAFPKRTIGLTHKTLKREEMSEIWRFYSRRCGAWEPFWFLFPLPDSWSGEYVGTGDGLTATFDLPSKNTDSVVIYVDGVSSSFIFVAGGGQAGCDQVTLDIAPASGAVITSDFYGQLRLKARFGGDRLTKKMFAYLLFNAQIEIMEVK